MNQNRIIQRNISNQNKEKQIQSNTTNMQLHKSTNKRQQHFLLPPGQLQQMERPGGTNRV